MRADKGEEMGNHLSNVLSEYVGTVHCVSCTLGLDTHAGKELIGNVLSSGMRVKGWVVV